MPSRAPRRARPGVPRLIVVLSAALLVIGLAAAVLLRDSTPPAPVTAVTTPPVLSTRTAEVQALLVARADAVLRKDRAAFMATVDPTQPAFRSRQDRLIQALKAVPLSAWRYELDPARHPPDLGAEGRHRGIWWGPSVSLRYALAGFDREPTIQQQWLTFVQRGGRWYVAADDDFAASGYLTKRDLWDGGPVIAERGSRCLVLAHPAGAVRARSLVSECEAAVKRVTAVWRTGWSRRVILLLPDTPAELGRIVTDAGDITQIAAFATTELLNPTSGYHPVGDRVVINPVRFAQLGALGRGVVLTHEVTHVATRPATGPEVPTWLLEGFADYVAFQGVDLPLTVAASELRADVRQGRVPRRLPVSADFSGSREDLPQIYEQSWLAVTLLVETYGQAAILKLYRAVGADQAAGSLERNFRTQLRTSVKAFTNTWRADLPRRLA